MVIMRGITVSELVYEFLLSHILKFSNWFRCLGLMVII